MLATNIEMYIAENVDAEGSSFVFSALRSKQTKRSGGRSKAGYSERYDARPNASIALMGFSDTALAMARRMAQLVKTLVGRPMQVAIVKGLNKYLALSIPNSFFFWEVKAHAAPVAMLSHLISFLGDVNSREEAAWPDSAICIRAFAQRRSRRM